MTDPTIPSSDRTPTMPSAARLYDYALFGKHHYEIDRVAAHKMLEMDPTAVWMVRENRAYLGRVVRYLAQECGIRQFVDVGSGLPTQRNVHQVAQEHIPDARVVYVDNDPIVLAHGRALLADDDTTIVLTADAGRPEEILASPEVRGLIDFTRPVGLLYLSVLHFLLDEADPWGAVRRMAEAVPSGSYLAISTLTTRTSEHGEAFVRHGQAVSPTFQWGGTRRPEQIDRFFEGLEIVPPGLGDVAAWRPDLGPTLLPRPDSPEGPGDWPPAWGDDVVDPTIPKTLIQYGGVARKP